MVWTDEQLFGPDFGPLPSGGFGPNLCHFDFGNSFLSCLGRKENQKGDQDCSFHRTLAACLFPDHPRDYLASPLTIPKLSGKIESLGVTIKIIRSSRTVWTLPEPGSRTSFSSHQRS